MNKDLQSYKADKYKCVKIKENFSEIKSMSSYQISIN